MRKLLIVVVLLALIAAGVYVWKRGAAPDATPGTGDAVVAILDANAPLAFVPADTPYVIANLERMPKETVDAFLKQSEPALKLWRTQFDLLSARATGADERGAQWVRAINDEFKDKTLEQSIAAMGLDSQAYSAVYGIGLVPVARLTLADPAAFRAFVARLEAGSGETIPTGRIDEVDYWQFTEAEAPLRGILAIQGDHLIATVAPVGDDSALRTLLGIERPAKSLRDATALAALNSKYGYTPYATGYVDTARLLTLFTAPSTPLEAAFLTALKVEKPVIDATCQAEYAALATAAPRLVIGYTRLEPKGSIGITRLELRSDIAQDLMKLRAPMPGLDAADASAFNLGFSLKLAEVPPLASKWANAVAAAPWKCESLTQLNEAYAEAGVQASNPAVFMAAPVFQGFHAMLSRFEMPKGGATPDFAGKILIGSPNPASLLATAGNFAPQLAQLKLEPNGKVQAVPPLAGTPVANLPTHAAMTDTLLGLSIGAGEEATLLDAMTVDPTRQPLLVVGYSGTAFNQIMQNMMETVPTGKDAAEQAEMEQTMKVMREMYALIRRVEMRVEFDEHGVAVHQSASMN